MVKWHLPDLKRCINSGVIQKLCTEQVKPLGLEPTVSELIAVKSTNSDNGESTLDVVLRSYEEKASELDVSREANTTLTAEVNHLLDKIKALTGEKDELRFKCEELECELVASRDALTKEIDLLRKEKDKMVDENVKMRQRIVELQEELVASRRQQITLTQKIPCDGGSGTSTQDYPNNLIDRLQNDNDVLALENERLEQKIENLQRELAKSRRHNNMPVEDSREESLFDMCDGAISTQEAIEMEPIIHNITQRFREEKTDMENASERTPTVYKNDKGKQVVIGGSGNISTTEKLKTKSDTTNVSARTPPVYMHDKGKVVVDEAGGKDSKIQRLKTKTRKPKINGDYVYEQRKRPLPDPGEDGRNTNIPKTKRGKWTKEQADYLKKLDGRCKGPNCARELSSDSVTKLMVAVDKGMSETVYHDEKKRISVTVEEIYAILRGKYIATSVIDAYASELCNSLGNKHNFWSITAVGGDCWVRVKDAFGKVATGDQYVEAARKAHGIVFFPILSNGRLKTKDPYHWSLLVADVKKEEWCFYNSMKPRRVTDEDEFCNDAIKVKQAMEEHAMGKIPLVSKAKCQPLANVKNIPQDDDDPFVCGLYVCYFMKQLADKQWIPSYLTPEQLKAFKVELIETVMRKN